MFILLAEKFLNCDWLRRAFFTLIGNADVQSTNCFSIVTYKMTKLAVLISNSHNNAGEISEFNLQEIQEFSWGKRKKKKEKH